MSKVQKRKSAVVIKSFQKTTHVNSYTHEVKREKKKETPQVHQRCHLSCCLTALAQSGGIFAPPLCSGCCPCGGGPGWPLLIRLSLYCASRSRISRSRISLSRISRSLPMNSSRLIAACICCCCRCCWCCWCCCCWTCSSRMCSVRLSRGNGSRKR